MNANEKMMPSIETMPEQSPGWTDGQRLFLLYYTGTLMDLVVLNLFAEYWSSKVFVSSFSVSLAAALVLQLLLKGTIAVEHRIAHYWKSKGPGGWNTFMRYFCAWLVLFGSKFVILEAIAQIFGKQVHFGGMLHGVVTLIVVVVVMLVAEELVVRIFRRII